MNHQKCPLNTPKHPNDQEPHRADKLECAESSHRPQHNSHVDRALRRIVRACSKSLQATRTQHHSHECKVADEPDHDDSGTERFVVIFLLLCIAHFALLGWGLHNDLAHLGLILSIQVAVVGGDVYVDFTARLECRRRQLLGLVVSFGTPSDVVGVTEGVDIENVDVGGRKEEVLNEGGEHVPRVKEEE